jgi:class 3 adenylate cyclase
MPVRHRRLDDPSEVRTFPHGRVEGFALGDAIVGRGTCEPGWHWAEHIRPIVGTELCELGHAGFSVSGRLRVRMADGSEDEIGPGEVFDIPPGHDAWVVGDEAYVTLDFATSRFWALGPEAIGRTTLATILLTDLVDSTRQAEAVGDARWKVRLSQHNDAVIKQLERFGGRAVKTTGDGVLAIFDSAERAIRSAAAIVASVGEQGLQVRCGLHCGEVEVLPDDVRGLAVHAAARVMALGGPQEVLVSGMTRELVAASPLRFQERGPNELKGLSGTWMIYALVPPDAG